MCGIMLPLYRGYLVLADCSCHLLFVFAQPILIVEVLPELYSKSVSYNSINFQNLV